MNIEQFRREVAIAAQGNTTSVTQAERALRKKGLQKCVQALNQFAAASLATADRGERPRRAPLPPELLPPVA